VAELTEDFLSIVLNETPLLDVRAPVEFEKGAFKNSTNIPILEDEERRLVGIEYKNRGNEAAVALARELIQEQGKELRREKWLTYLNANPSAILYCFRGGQRSGIAQQWLQEMGQDIVRIKGGYKAFRNYLMEESLAISKELNTLIIGGRTGSGKTLLLQDFENALDLEGLAHHRGSSFGAFSQRQNTQIGFEDDLAYALIQMKHTNHQTIVIEHESHNIGQCYIPKEVYKNFMQGKLIILHTPMEQRVAITHKEYVSDAIAEYEKHYGDAGVDEWAKRTLFSLNKIRKRVGSQRHHTLETLFNNALEHYKKDAGLEDFKEFIEILLRDYYDPMYDYQIQKTPLEIIFEGNPQEVKEFLKNY